MSKTSRYSVTVNGEDVTTSFSSRLLAATVTLNAGDEGDTALITVDDTGGTIEIPEMGVKIAVALGWAETGLRTVFDGTVDEVVSTGNRSGGRTLAIAAKGFEAEGPAKEKKRRHWDDASVEKILKDAAGAAGIGTVRVDPDLAKISLKYWSMEDESLIHMGQRLARRIGGNFQVQGQTLLMARRGASYTPTITARDGDNLHGWDLAPNLGRKIYAKVVAPFFDRKTGKWDKAEAETGLGGDAVLTISPPANDKDDANRQAKAQAEASKRAAGGGSVTIEGNADAVCDGLCVVSGARSGIDGKYRITSVNHMISRSAGFVTQVQLGHPDISADQA